MSTASEPQSAADCKRPVWVVDGDGPRRGFVLDSLTSHGFEVRGFHDIESAVLNGKPENGCVLITAEKLPDGHFGELLSRLTHVASSLSTIVTSFDGTVERAVNAFRHGANDYLVEPYSRDELCNVVQRALKKQTP
ncbi:MAG: response regulator [Gammaproteobacteria bacterium]